MKADAADKLIECARQEFLQKGYDAASLRETACKAGVSTYLIYDRFTDKAGLLEAVVAPARKGLIDAYAHEMQLFNETKPDAPYDTMLDYATKQSVHIVDVIYSDFATYKLMTLCPEQTGFDSMLHALAEVHDRQTQLYLTQMGLHVLDNLSEDLKHVIYHSLFSGLFESVRHDMRYDAAIAYYQQFLQYHMTGFKAFLA